MQLSVSTPSSDTNLAALLLGGEPAPAAAPALPAAGFEQLITGLAPLATPAPASAVVPSAPAVSAAPVALLVAPALRNFTPAAPRAAAAPAPAEAELPLPVPGEVTVPTVATAKAAARPAPRAPARGFSAKSESPTVPAPAVTPEQLPPVAPLAPQPLPTDLLTLAPAAVAAEASAPAEPALAPHVAIAAHSATQGTLPVVAHPTALGPATSPLSSRRDPTAAPLSGAPLTAPDAVPVTSAAPAPTPSALTPGAVTTQAPQVSAGDSSVAPGRSDPLVAATSAALHTFAPADLVSRQFTASPRGTATAAPETIAASYADSRSPERLSRLSRPTLANDPASVAPTLPVVSSPLPSAGLTASFTVPAAPAAPSVLPASASSLPSSVELAPDFAASAAAAPLALPTGVIAPSTAPAASVPAAPLASAEALAASNNLPAADASNSSLAPKAKIAARAEIRGTAEKIDFSASGKNFLNTEDKGFANAHERVGTDVAKSGPVMSTTTFSEQPASAVVPAPASFAPVARVEATDFSAIEATSAPGESASVADAHRAVEAVLVAADRTANGDRHTVNLHFTVAGNELAVRVEMRADEVRATFHTASPELRDALAREWQAVRADPSTDSSLRLAPAVFTSGGASSSLGGDASSRQRDPGAQRGDDQTFFTSAPRSLRTPDSAPASSVLTPATPANPRGGAHRLLAHA